MSALPVEILSSPSRAAAVLHPIRLAILRELKEPKSAGGLARVIPLSRQKLNYHLRELEKEGFLELVAERPRGKVQERIFRARATSYLISPEVLGALGADPEKVKDRFSLSYLVATAARAIRDLAMLRRKGDDQGKRVPTMTVQTEVRFASPDDRAAFAEEIANEIARLTAKYHTGEPSPGRAYTLFTGMYPTLTDPTPAPHPEIVRTPPRPWRRKPKQEQPDA